MSASVETIYDALEREVNSLELTFTAKGTRREDGLTSADIEEEQRNQQEKDHGLE
jgi:hypothetical protein